MEIAFIGHALISAQQKTKELVKEQLRNYMIDQKAVTCYLGGYGDFDDLCAHACIELKKECYNIKVVYVTPYITLSEQAKIQKMQRDNLCDTSIYPPIEKTPLKFAILKRNEWMMTNADLIIAYVNHSFGGAYQSLQVAKRKQKKIINICDFMQ